MAGRRTAAPASRCGPWQPLLGSSALGSEMHTEARPDDAYQFIRRKIRSNLFGGQAALSRGEASEQGPRKSDGHGRRAATHSNAEDSDGLGRTRTDSDGPPWTRRGRGPPGSAPPACPPARLPKTWPRPDRLRAGGLLLGMAVACSTLRLPFLGRCRRQSHNLSPPILSLSAAAAAAARRPPIPRTPILSLSPWRARP